MAFNIRRTPEEKERVRVGVLEMEPQGLSYLQMAKRLNVSKGQVAGEVYRLREEGLLKPSTESGIRAASSFGGKQTRGKRSVNREQLGGNHQASITGGWVSGVLRTTEVYEPKFQLKQHPVPLTDIAKVSDGECRFPYDYQDHVMQMCGHPAPLTGPYCSLHTRYIRDNGFK